MGRFQGLSEFRDLLPSRSSLVSKFTSQRTHRGRGGAAAGLIVRGGIKGRVPPMFGPLSFDLRSEFRVTVEKVGAHIARPSNSGETDGFLGCDQTLQSSSSLLLD